MRLRQPRTQLVERRVRMRPHLGQNGVMPAGEPAWRMRALRARHGLAAAIAPLPRLDHIGDADPEARRYRPRTARNGQHAVAQILRIGLSPPPRHLPLRSPPTRGLPESDESHVRAESESPSAIPPSLRLL
jgi:hypothetical protein